MEKLKLKDHPYANCYVLKDYNNEEIIAIHFISYITEVITAVKIEDYWVIKCSGTYSPTTRKQIGYFLKEYFPGLSYYHIKSIAGRKMHIQYIDENNPIKFFNVSRETK